MSPFVVLARGGVLVQATEAIVPLEDEVFGPLIRQMMSLLETYGDREVTTIREFLDRAAVVISRSGPGAAAAPDPTAAPGAAAAPDPPGPQTSRRAARRHRLPNP